VARSRAKTSGHAVGSPATRFDELGLKATTCRRRPGRGGRRGRGEAGRLAAGGRYADPGPVLNGPGWAAGLGQEDVRSRPFEVVADRLSSGRLEYHPAPPRRPDLPVGRTAGVRFPLPHLFWLNDVGFAPGGRADLIAVDGHVVVLGRRLRRPARFPRWRRVERRKRRPVGLVWRDKAVEVQSA